MEHANNLLGMFLK